MGRGSVSIRVGRRFGFGSLLRSRCVGPGRKWGVALLGSVLGGRVALASRLRRS